jgi:hypothetical protein
MCVCVCRQRLESRRKEAQAAEAAVKELTERERRLEGELEEATKQVRDLKEEADNLKDTETSEAQHVQVQIPCRHHVAAVHFKPGIAFDSVECKACCRCDQDALECPCHSVCM